MSLPPQRENQQVSEFCSLTIDEFFYKNGFDIFMELEYSKERTADSPVTNLVIRRGANKASTPSLMLQSFKYIAVY